MAFKPVQLFPTRTVPATATTLVTAGIVTRVDKLTFSNPSTSPVTVTVYLVPSGNSAGASNQISLKVLNVNESWTCYDAVNAILNVGDLLSVSASTASVVVVGGSGTQIS